MDIFFRKKIIFSALFCLFLSACYFEKNDTYEIYSPWLISEISTQKANVNIIYYFLRQTHEPLFRKDDGENYTTKLLNDWGRNQLSTEFTFCPNKNLFFNKNTRFDDTFFSNYITRTTQKFESPFSITNIKGCFKIVFKSPQKKYLDFLTFYENAPTVKRTEAIEDGLGMFYVDAFKKDEVILKRKKSARFGYNKIIAHKLDASATSKLSGIDADSGTKDFNFFKPDEIPDQIKHRYITVSALEIKSVVLILNHPDKKVRELLYNCMDIESLQNAFFYGKNLDFNRIASILPVGVYGAESGKPFQVCEPNKQSAGNEKEITLGNYYGDSNRIPLETYFQKLQKRTGLNIKIKDITTDELISDKKHKGYQLSIIALDATRNDPLTFLGMAGDPKRSEYDFRTLELENIYKSLLHSRDKETEAKLIRAGAEIIKNKHLALPLFQIKRKLYYPSDIKNIIVGRDFLQYPEIAEFRW